MTFWLAVVFFLSGGAALVYQIVWQRALFVLYGLDAALGLSSTVHATAVLNAWLGVVVFGMASRERRTT